MKYYERDKARFASYVKVAFVRNPWDRLVSAFFYLKNLDEYSSGRKFFDEIIGQKTTFREFVLDLNEPSFRKKVLGWQHFCMQTVFLQNSEKVIDLDFLGKYENLEMDYELLKKMVNPSASSLSIVNSSSRTNCIECYDVEMARIVERIYLTDVKNFGYSRPLELC